MPRRTKACATCRQKRIKCDATMPHCTMCKKFGRQCPGPTDAPLLFIDNSAFPSGRRPKRPRKVVQSIVETSTTDEDSGAEELPYEVAFVVAITVSPRYVLHEAFYANFLGFFCAEGRHMPGAMRRTPTWLHSLQSLASSSRSRTKLSDASTSALALALRATTAAFSGVETRNPGLVEYAAGLYGAALRGQGRVLALEKGGGEKAEMEMLATSIMLGMFEAVVSTTGEAYAAHIVGAAKMMDSILKKIPKPTVMVNDGPPPGAGRGGRGRGGRGGAERGGGEAGGRGRGGGGMPPGKGGPPAGAGAGPQPLQTGIFFHLRFQLAFVSLTTTSHRLRNDPIIKLVVEDCCGWDYDKLPPMQQMLRPLTRLTYLLYSPPYPSLQVERNTTWERIKEEVDTLWGRYQREGGTGLCWTTETGKIDFRDPFTSLHYAYFSACWILLDLLAPNRHHETNVATIPIRGGSASPESIYSTTPLSDHQQSPDYSSSSTSSYTTPTVGSRSSSSSSPPSSSLPPPSATKDHHGLILSVAWYLRLRDVGFSYLRLHSPLFLVAMYAPQMEQRRVARMIFEEWRDGALRGIGELGLERVLEADTMTAGTVENLQNLYE